MCYKTSSLTQEELAKRDARLTAGVAQKRQTFTTVFQNMMIKNKRRISKKNNAEMKICIYNII